MFRRSEVPREGFYINRMRKISFISKRLAENFYNRAKVLQFSPNLKGKVVWSLPSYICPAGGYSTPWGVTLRSQEVHRSEKSEKKIPENPDFPDPDPDFRIYVHAVAIGG